MPYNVKLNFPPMKFRLTEPDTEGVVKIFDKIRGTYLVLTPEEWVRQNLVQFLVQSQGVPTGLISLEHPVKIQGMDQRADVVVFNSSAKPVLLVECKAAGVKIDQTVFAQAVRYNSVVGARYLMITNGLNHYIYQKDDEESGYVTLSELPEF